VLLIDLNSYTAQKLLPGVAHIASQKNRSHIPHDLQDSRIAAHASEAPRARFVTSLMQTAFERQQMGEQP